LRLPLLGVGKNMRPTKEMNYGNTITDHSDIIAGRRVTNMAI
jgi:hypothetical protein